MPEPSSEKKALKSMLGLRVWGSGMSGFGFRVTSDSGFDTGLAFRGLFRVFCVRSWAWVLDGVRIQQRVRLQSLVVTVQGCYNHGGSSMILHVQRPSTHPRFRGSGGGCFCDDGLGTFFWGLHDGRSEHTTDHCNQDWV